MLIYIGLEGLLNISEQSIDKIVSTEEQFLDAIEKTIYQIESYYNDSVRASVGNYLVSLYIKENTPDVVIYCGDVSDEIFGSYRGFKEGSK